MTPKKTYRAIRHDVVRTKQKGNCRSVHHPDEKENQIKKVFSEVEWDNSATPNIIEFFAGQGNLTSVYETYGNVISYDKSLGTGDSYMRCHNLIAEGKTFDVIDIDPYGFPTRFFPDVFLLIDNGVMFVTMPKPSVNILNGISATHLISYFGEQNPSEEAVIERIALWGLCHWRKVVLIDSMDFKSIWRFAFSVQKVKATDYTGVRNRADLSIEIKPQSKQLYLEI